MGKMGRANSIFLSKTRLESSSSLNCFCFLSSKVTRKKCNKDRPKSSKTHVSHSFFLKSCRQFKSSVFFCNCVHDYLQTGIEKNEFEGKRNFEVLSDASRWCLEEICEKRSGDFEKFTGYKSTRMFKGSLLNESCYSNQLLQLKNLRKHLFGINYTFFVTKMISENFFYKNIQKVENDDEELEYSQTPMVQKIISDVVSCRSRQLSTLESQTMRENLPVGGRGCFNYGRTYREYLTEYVDFVRREKVIGRIHDPSASPFDVQEVKRFIERNSFPSNGYVLLFSKDTAASCGLLKGAQDGFWLDFYFGLLEYVDKDQTQQKEYSLDMDWDVSERDVAKDPMLKPYEGFMRTLNAKKNGSLTANMNDYGLGISAPYHNCLFFTEGTVSFVTYWEPDGRSYNEKRQNRKVNQVFQEISCKYGGSFSLDKPIVKRGDQLKIGRNGEYSYFFL